MTTTNLQTNIPTEIFSIDGDKSISISQLGLTLTRDILTTPIQTIITPLDITDINTGNVITMDRLTYLPIGLAALEAPPNPTTLHIQDTLLVDNIPDLNSTTVAYNSIVLTDGTTTNTINKTGYSTKNTVANLTHYLNFSDASTSGIGPIQKTAGISCNPSTNVITATTFDGTTTNATNVGITSDNTSGTYYIPFVKTIGNGNKPLFIDDATGPLTYNPSTATISTNIININALPTTVNVASRFGQVGLVKLQTITTTINGSALPLTITLSNIFTSAYKNYRIILQPRSDVNFTAYPAYNLSAFLGTGTLPTIANLYGFEMTSSATTVVSPLFTTGIVIASTPVIVAVSGLTNKVVSFDITNVGYTTSSATVVNINCKSFYNNPGINGVSDRNIQIASTSGSTITGLTLQQTSIGVGNFFDLNAIIYGYNQL